MSKKAFYHTPMFLHIIPKIVIYLSDINIDTTTIYKVRSIHNIREKVFTEQISIFIDKLIVY